MRIFQGHLKRLLPWLMLLVMGVLWGLSFSLGRLAVENGGTPLGITFWQAAISSIILITYAKISNRNILVKLSNVLPLIIIALLGILIPSICFYIAASHVPAGILAITVVLVPILTYCLALLFKIESFNALRITGVILGAVAIILLIFPEDSLPTPKTAPWVLLACVSSLCYALENIFLSLKRTGNIGSLKIACSMNAIAAILLLFLAIFFDQLFILNLPFSLLEWSVIGLGLITSIAYTLYVYTVKVSGPVFASQVGYIVTSSGVMWGILIFDEVHSAWVWGSLFIMLIGLSLVLPKKMNNADTPQ